MFFSGQRRFIRGLEVVLENTAAKILHITPARIHAIIRKERQRFPDNFMVSLSEREQLLLGTNEHYAFTLSGLMMLAILNDDNQAVKIIRAATELRRCLLPNDKLDIFDLILKMDQE